MSAATAAARGQAAAARLMTDTCTLSAPDVEGVLDEQTGQYTTAPGAQRYSGRCRVRPADSQERVVEAGERPVSLRTYVVSVPVTVTGVEVGDVVRVTASVLDPDLAGVRLRVVDVPKGTHLTARRLICEEAS